MAWLSRNNFTPSDKLHADDLNNLANDDRTWGGDVNGGGYILSNVVLVGVTTQAPPVSSVFGRTGDVVAVTGDYTPDQVGAVPLTRVIGADGTLSGGGALSADLTLSVTPDTTKQKVALLSAGAAVATRSAVNFVSGANVTVSVTDNPGANRVDVAISSTGGGGGMVDPTTTLGDLIVRGSATTNRLPVGLDGLVLTADSANSLGMKWAAGGGAQTPWASNIDGATHSLQNVGAIAIGAVSAAAKLHVLGAGADGGGNCDVRIIGSGNIGSGISLQSTDSGGKTWSLFSSGSVAGLPGGLGFFDASVGSYAMWIASGHNVGIGTQSPQATLDVNGQIYCKGSESIIGGLKSTATIGSLVITSSDPAISALLANLVVYGGASGPAQRLTIGCVEQGVAFRNITFCESGGWVGVGKSTPTRMLDVAGGLALQPGSYSGTATELDVTNKSLIIVTGSGGNQITGLIGGVDGAIVGIVNASAGAIALLKQNAGSASGNQIRMPASFSMLNIAISGCAILTWSSITGQWNILSYFSG